MALTPCLLKCSDRGVIRVGKILNANNDDENNNDSFQLSQQYSIFITNVLKQSE